MREKESVRENERERKCVEREREREREEGRKLFFIYYYLSETIHIRYNSIFGH